MEKVFELARERGWSLPNLRDHLAESGLDVPLPTLRSWAYGQRQPSVSVSTKLAKIVAGLGNPAILVGRKTVRLRVTPRQIHQANADPLMQGIAVSGARGSKKNPIRLEFFEGPNNVWLPLADVVIWSSHVEKFNPTAIKFFRALFDLLGQSPNHWLRLTVELRPFTSEEA